MTIVINSALLFAVLLYIYPLKFMFDSFMLQVFGLRGHAELERMSLEQLARASMLYGLGFAILTGLLALLYGHAYRRRHALGMSDLDAFDTRVLAGHQLVSMSVGLFAMLFALLGPRSLAFLSPSSFALMGPWHYFYGRHMEKRRLAFRASFLSATSESVTPVDSMKSV
jgi:hypothetical protein